jgi:hypothetical protein
VGLEVNVGNYRAPEHVCKGVFDGMTIDHHG